MAFRRLLCPVASSILLVDKYQAVLSIARMLLHFFITWIGFFAIYLFPARYSQGLNKFNGPFVASFSNLWKLWYAFSSSQKQLYVDIHRKYGDIVRLGPNELSFADPQAIHDIYGPNGASQKVCYTPSSAK
jgi:hypothetical protein